jgi:LPS O-antigen subunit length determinant protein (WzzB/FepE family)
MTENKNYTNFPQQQEEDEMEIDLMEYARKLWAARKLLLKVAGLAIIVGIVIALTTPKQYTVSVTLAPESSKSGGGGLSGIASMLGVGGFNMGSDADALNVTLYPDIVSSTPFILDLMDTPVSTIDEEQPDTTLVGYLKEYTSSSLMGTVMSLPFKAIGGIMSLFKSEEEEKTDIINPFHLTQEQSQTVNGLKKMIVANVDKKTGVTTVSVTMQDPMVAAILTDTVIVKLKEHISKYRTSEAEENCKDWEELNKVRQDDYYIMQKKYAEDVDANKNVVLQSVRIEQERLQNEMNLAYQVYSSVASQLQMAKAKVQEAKPVFAVVEPASVPLQPSGTSRKMILLGVVFLAVAAAAAWVLFGEDLWKNLKEGLAEKKEEE